MSRRARRAASPVIRRSIIRGSFRGTPLNRQAWLFRARDLGAVIELHPQLERWSISQFGPMVLATAPPPARVLGLVGVGQASVGRARRPGRVVASSN